MLRPVEREMLPMITQQEWHSFNVMFCKVIQYNPTRFYQDVSQSVFSLMWAVVVYIDPIR